VGKQRGQVGAEADAEFPGLVGVRFTLVGAAAKGRAASRVKQASSEKNAVGNENPAYIHGFTMSQ